MRKFGVQHNHQSPKLTRSQARAIKTVYIYMYTYVSYMYIIVTSKQARIQPEGRGTWMNVSPPSPSGNQTLHDVPLYNIMGIVVGTRFLMNSTLMSVVPPVTNSWLRACQQTSITRRVLNDVLILANVNDKRKNYIQFLF